VSGIDQLKVVDASAIAELLTSEHPQIIAAILVQLDTSVAARVLNNLPQRLCHQVVPRIATLQSVHGAALQDLDEGLRSALFSRGQAIGNPLRGGVTPVAEMLMYLGANLKGSLLDSIARQDPDMAQKLLQKMAGSKPAPA
jgi:flagellar motor switch protein FliG